VLWACPVRVLLRKKIGLREGDQPKDEDPTQIQEDGYSQDSADPNALRLKH
jgi:hypothetical protein